MAISLTRQEVGELGKKLAELIGSDVQSADILQALAQVLRREPDHLSDELDVQSSRRSTDRIGDGYDFPREPRSSFNHISGDAIRESVIHIISGFENYASGNANVRLMIDRDGTFPPSL
jgi:hypothetical protein